MNRKTFSYKLKDNNLYVFSERSKEDIDYSHIQNKIRDQVIEDTFRRFEGKGSTAEDLRDAIIMTTTNAVYGNDRINEFILSNPVELKRLCYASFKVANPGMGFDDFAELLDESSAKKILNMIAEIEKDDNGLPDKTVCEELGISKTILIDRIKKNHPEVYDYLRKNLRIKKKKVE